MISSFILTAVRNILRYRMFAAINIVGLTLGISCALFIFLIVKFELSYDTYHPHVERIYRINSGRPGDLEETMDTGSPHALATFVRKDLAEIEKVGIAFKINPENSNVEANGELTRIDELYFIDPGFLELFSFNWVEGSSAKILQNANEAAISKSMAGRLFAGEAVGKLIRVNDATDFTVIAIFDDPPINSDFPIEVMLSHKTFEQDKNAYFPDRLDAGWNSYYQTYVRLAPQARVADLLPKFNSLIEKHVSKEFAEKQLAFALQPLTAIHFENGNFKNRIISHEAINILRVIGFVILVIACINFVNLATAQAARRAKEVGIRKSLGSSRKQLIFQFLGETFVVTLLALILSIAIVGQLATVAETLIEIPLSQNGLLEFDSLIFMGGLLATVTSLAGFYPAIVLSGFRPVIALKSSAPMNSLRGLILRKGLIASQFMVAQALIIGTLVVILQVRYFETKPLGFNKQAVLTTDLPFAEKSKLATLRNSLLQYPEIKNVSFSLNTPSATINKWWDNFEHANFPGEVKITELKLVDSLYLGMFEIQKAAGTLDFTPGARDQVIVNETLVKECGIESPEKAIGEKIKMWGTQMTIIGVVRNFQTVTLREGFYPLVLVSPTDGFFQKASLKIDMQHSREAIAHLQTHWNELFPNHYFTYAFLDDALSTFYQDDRKIARLLGMFAIVAVGIGCLGLLGLIMFVAVQRTKEVGIRKILGATVTNIITLLSKDFVLLVMVASACAWPVAWYLMDQWLQEFANPISLTDNFWVFGAAGLLSLVFALITVGYQALKAALTNPTESLRTE